MTPTTPDETEKRQWETWRQAKIKRLYKELHANSLERAGIVEELQSLGENIQKKERQQNGLRG